MIENYAIMMNATMRRESSVSNLPGIFLLNRIIPPLVLESIPE